MLTISSACQKKTVDFPILLALFFGTRSLSQKIAIVSRLFGVFCLLKKKLRNRASQPTRSIFRNPTSKLWLSGGRAVLVLFVLGSPKLQKHPASCRWYILPIRFGDLSPVHVHFSAACRITDRASSFTINCLKTSLRFAGLAPFSSVAIQWDCQTSDGDRALPEVFLSGSLMFSASKIIPSLPSKWLEQKGVIQSRSPLFCTST